MIVSSIRLRPLANTVKCQETGEKTLFGIVLFLTELRVGNRKAANFRENTNNNNTQVSNVLSDKNIYLGINLRSEWSVSPLELVNQTSKFFSTPSKK